jgi:hypothetical protein
MAGGRLARIAGLPIFSLLAFDKIIAESIISVLE